MRGTPAILVSRDSATHTRPSNDYPRFLIAINRSHSEMVKFERYSDDYEIALRCLRELVRTTREIVGRRLKNGELLIPA